MNTTADLSNVMTKLANLKALASQPGTADEAAAALAAIQRLMMRHDISEVELASIGEAEREPVAQEDYDLGSSYTWRKILLVTLAKSGNCQVMFAARGSGAHIFGRKHNTAVVIGMYEYLIQAINRLADEGWSRADLYTKRTEHARGWKNAFRVGATKTICERIDAQRKEVVASEGGSALVVADDAAARSALVKAFPQSRSRTARAAGNSADGVAAGVVAGGGVSLDGQVGGGSGKRTKALRG